MRALAAVMRGATRAAVTLAVILAAGALSPLAAQDVFSVKVPVDVTSDSAANARDKALADAPAAGLKQLLERLAVKEDHGILPPVDRQRAGRMLLGFEIQDERLSQVRYIANVILRFDGQAVREELRLAGARFAEAATKPVLILPVYQDGAAPKLWDERHPWARALSDLPTGEGIVPVALPLGDTTDMQEVRGGAVQRDPARIGAIAARYGASEAVVAQLVAGTAKDGRSILTLTVDRFGAGGQGQVISKTYAYPPPEELEPLFARIAKETLGAIEEQWKRGNVVATGQTQALDVQVLLQSLKDWVEIRDRLNKVSQLRQQKILSLTRERTVLQLGFDGTPEQLQAAFARQGLQLAQGAVGWTLALAP